MVILDNAPCDLDLLYACVRACARVYMYINNTFLSNVTTGLLN